MSFPTVSPSYQDQKRLNLKTSCNGTEEIPISTGIEPEITGYAVFSLQTLFFHLLYVIIAIFLLLLILLFNSIVYNFVVI